MTRRLHQKSRNALIRSAPTLLLITAVLVLVFNFRLTAHAAELIQRSVTIDSPRPSDTTSYTFGFTFNSSSAIGSIHFEFCENSPIFGTACTAPAGLDVNGATIATQTGETGFGMHGSTNSNNIVITRPSSGVTPQPGAYRFSGVINPSQASRTVYVRIGTYASIDATGAVTDNGTVVFSTSSGIGTAGYVPPYMNLCVGLTVAANCSSLFGGMVDFGELSKTNHNATTSQFAIACNDVLGYNVYIIGTTLTAGNSVIPNMTTPQSISPGTSGFGINLRANNNPVVGANPSGAGTGSPTSNYNSTNQFAFNNNDLLASSTVSSDFNVFTVSYLANVSNSQPPGIYTTTLTFVAIAQF